MKEHYSRRNFLSTAAVSAAVAVLPDYASASEKPEQKSGIALNPHPVKLGLMTYNVGKSWDIDTIIKNCKAAKFEHVQLRTTHKHGVEVTMNKQQRSEVKKRFQDAGLEISLASGFMYHSPDKAELRKNIEGSKEYLQLAADVGAHGIRVFPNAIPKEGQKERERMMEQIGKSVSEVATVGHNLGVEVRLEEHGTNTENIPVIKKILDYADNPYVYIIWNSSPNDFASPGLETQFNMVKDRIRNVHLREMFDDYPWRQFFALLGKSGFKGYCDAELSDESCEPVRMMNNYRTSFLAFQNAI
jgi:sugar phosphate isomerase/epimerase